MATGLALAGTLVILFILCVIAQVVVPGIQLSHMWLNLFTVEPFGSVSSWIQGVLSSLVVGFVAGWLFGAIYNKKASWLEKKN
jgi:ABC-type antimicrobial peptide transport system permease subunit